MKAESLHIWGYFSIRLQFKFKKGSFTLRVHAGNSGFAFNLCDMTWPFCSIALIAPLTLVHTGESPKKKQKKFHSKHHSLQILWHDFSHVSRQMLRHLLTRKMSSRAFSVHCEAQFKSALCGTAVVVGKPVSTMSYFRFMFLFFPPRFLTLDVFTQTGQISLTSYCIPTSVHLL